MDRRRQLPVIGKDGTMADSKVIYPLLELSKWPTMPAPWQSTDSGETWLWGDFFLTFQKSPGLICDLLPEMKQITGGTRLLKYHCAMFAFYRRDRNPHGATSCPIMAVSLEEVDIGRATQSLPPETRAALQAEAGMQHRTLMLGLFIGEGRFNLGSFDGYILPEKVKERFFEIIGARLALTGQPKYIGTLLEAYGHPETGLPPKKRKVGCMGIFGATTGIVGLGAVAATFLAG